MPRKIGMLVIRAWSSQNIQLQKLYREVVSFKRKFKNSTDFISFHWSLVWFSSLFCPLETPPVLIYLIVWIVLVLESDTVYFIPGSSYFSYTTLMQILCMSTCCSSTELACGILPQEITWLSLGSLLCRSNTVAT